MHRNQYLRIHQTHHMKTGELLCVKEFAKDALSPLKLAETRREVEISRRMRHCSKFPTFFSDWETGDKIVLVFGFCEYGTLARAMAAGKRVRSTSKEGRSGMRKSRAQSQEFRKLGGAGRSIDLAKQGSGGARASVGARGSHAEERDTRHKVTIGGAHRRGYFEEEGNDTLVEIRTEDHVAKLLVAPLVVALCALHESKIVHRRVSPDHVLFTKDGEARLGGLGMVLPLDEERAISRIGEERYNAPEVRTKPTLPELFEMAVLSGVDEDGLPGYDHRADTWSLGMIILDVLVKLQSSVTAINSLDKRGKLAQPHSRPSARGGTSQGELGTPDARLCHEILEDGGLPEETRVPLAGLVGSFSAEAIDFVRSCLKKDPAERPECRQLLGHSWVAKHVSAALLRELDDVRKVSVAGTGVREMLGRRSIEAAKGIARRNSIEGADRPGAPYRTNVAAGAPPPREGRDRNSLEARINQTSLFATYTGF